MSVRLGPVGLDRIVLATTNEGKARELERLLGGTVRSVETLREHAGVALPAETGRDYRANALAKARAVWNALGVPAVGDDSGLEVDALGGAPGLRSARYAGEKATDAENNAKLLAALDGLPPERRGTRYVCVLALARPDDVGPRGGIPVTLVRGTCRGRIATAPRGSGGFGYDPIFEPRSEAPGGRTLGEWSAEEKNAISHRGAAARRMSPILRRQGF